MKQVIPLAALCLSLFALVSCSKIKDRAAKAKAIVNLRILHVALDAYQMDKGQWPQVPEELKGKYDVKFFNWWKETLRPYGMEDENWFHPDDDEARKAGTGSFIPTVFDPEAFSPLRDNKPWAAEREDFGKGKLLLLPDGSIISEAEYLEKQKE